LDCGCARDECLTLSTLLDPYRYHVNTFIDAAMLEVHVPGDVEQVSGCVVSRAQLIGYDYKSGREAASRKLSKLVLLLTS
jgi:hypothetical protein